MDFWRFIGAIILLAAVVFVARHQPDFAVAFGDLTAAYNNEIYHTPIGDFAGNSGRVYCEHAGFPGCMSNPPAYYYGPAPTSTNQNTVPYPAN